MSLILLSGVITGDLILDVLVDIIRVMPAKSANSWMVTN